ncbi:ACT domain-containing protein [Celerinatantimonas yamalensis]|uniref:Glycine cleavage system transcriptional repressor n=1 Tax=Celerinatantimonas yamalensis TaxID=559956 RepID=A0ABW9GA51_9GAMM
MEHHLVITAVGRDRPDIVNQLTRHVSDCDCNIVDSRLALYGSEFTLIMLLSGHWNAITRVETTLPLKSQELELVTVMKRTSEHEQRHYPARATLKIRVPDGAGIIRQFTQFISDHGLALASLRSQLDYQILELEMTAYVSDEQVDEADLNDKFQQLCEKLKTESAEFHIHPQ